MKKLILLAILFLFPFCYISAQKIDSEWGFSTWQLNSDTITLIANTIFSKQIDLIEFKKDGKINYRHVGGTRCGNCSIWVDTSASGWSKNPSSNEITLELKYAHFMDTTYQIGALYKLDDSKRKKLILIKTKSLYYNAIPNSRSKTTVLH